MSKSLSNKKEKSMSLTCNSIKGLIYPIEKWKFDPFVWKRKKMIIQSLEVSLSQLIIITLTISQTWDGWYESQAEFEDKGMKSCYWERFCKNICNLIQWSNIKKMNDALSNIITNKVIKHCILKTLKDSKHNGIMSSGRSKH